jgi:hypothetical protein
MAINWCLVDVDSTKGESLMLTLLAFLAQPFKPHSAIGVLGTTVQATQCYDDQ